MKTLFEIINGEAFLQNLPDYKRGDCENIQRVSREMGISLTFQECNAIWEEFSNERDAQWLSTQSDEPEDIHEAIRSYIQKRVKNETTL